jgi:hypothetical protein
MVERLLEQFSQYLPLSQEERAAIKASALIRHYPPGKVITMDSCSRQNSFFVLQGLIREYELTPKEEVKPPLLYRKRLDLESRQLKP